MTPTLYTTSPAAQARFTPKEKGCYSEKEVTLKYLPYGMYRSAVIGCLITISANGRYDIGNCLFEAAYEEVLDTCGCTPYFHWGNVQLDWLLGNRPFCKVRLQS